MSFSIASLLDGGYIKMKSGNETNNILLIGAISILLGFGYFFASDMFVPSLPEISKYFSVGSSTTRLTISMFLISLSCSQLIYGPASDKFGRKPVILLGLIIFVIGSVICLISPSINMLLIGRVIQGLGIGALITLSKTIVQDSTSKEQFVKVVSILSVFFLIAPACAPLLGGILQTCFGWRSNFVFMLIFGIALFFIMLFLFKETNESRDPKALNIKVLHANYLNIIKNLDFIIMSYIVIVALGSIVVFYTIGPFLLLNKYHVSPITFGVFSVIIMGSALLARIITNAILMKLCSIEAVLIIGLILMAVGSIILILSALFDFSSLVLIMLSMCVMSAGGCLVAPIATTTALSMFPNTAGAAGAKFGFLQIGGLFLSSYIAAIIPASEINLAIILFIMASSAFFIHYVRSKVKKEN